MSLPQFPINDPPLTRDDAINQILASIAMEELGLSHIINAEGEKLQYAIGTIPGVTGISGPVTIDDLLALNKSVCDTLDSAMQSQIFLKSKMQGALNASTMQGPTGATGATGATGPAEPFLSSYMEALGDEQTVPSGAYITFDIASADSEGNNITLSADGTEFTINRSGLYQVEWTLNLAGRDPSAAPAVVGIIENGAGSSGSSSSNSGNFSSGTLIRVDTVPFVLGLYNYGDDITLERHAQFENSAASIRIIRFADGAHV